MKCEWNNQKILLRFSKVTTFKVVLIKQRLKTRLIYLGIKWKLKNQLTNSVPWAVLRSPSSLPGMKGSREFVWISFTRSWRCWLRSSCRSSLAPWRRSPPIPRRCAERGCTTFSCGSRTTTGAKQPSDTWEPAGALLLWLCVLLMGVVFFQRWREHAGQHFCGSFKCSERETTSRTLWWKPRPSVSANCSPSLYLHSMYMIVTVCLHQQSNNYFSRAAFQGWTLSCCNLKHHLETV